MINVVCVASFSFVMPHLSCLDSMYFILPCLFFCKISFWYFMIKWPFLSCFDSYYLILVPYDKFNVLSSFLS